MVKSSINIKYDSSNKNLVSGYFATSSHTDIFTNVLSSIQGNNKFNSIVAYGPYGAGKSYVSALLLGLVSNSFRKTDIKLLKNKLKVVDDSVNAIIEKTIEEDKKVLTVIISGIEGDFKTTLLNNVNKALMSSNVRVNFPGISSEIIKTIHRWKKSYEKTYHEFLFELTDFNFQISDFVSELRQGNDQCIEIFNDIYTKLTAGSKYYANFDSSIEDILHNVCNQLDKKGYHLFIVWDEFGRVLQNLHLSEINLFMQEIQDIAELANNGVNNLTTVFVAHKPLGFYLNFATKELRDEFAKVEKRFGVLEIKSDYITFLQITSEVLKTHNLVSEITSDDISALRKYNVFSSYLNDTELMNLVSQGSYPLHPITLYALPKLSSIFGQNERSLFSFLYDNSSNGLDGFIKKFKGYYYVDRLVDFFFTNIEKSYVEDLDVYNIYISNVKRIPVLISDDYVDATRVYKFAMIWRLINGNHILKLSSNFISYALGLDILRIEQILTKLSDIKLVRYNSLHVEWEIFKGSNLNLDKELMIANSKLKITREILVKLFNEKNPYKYLYSSKYNALNEITRFGYMKVRINNDEDKTLSDIKINLVYKGEEVPKNTKDSIIVKLQYDYSDVKDVLTNIYILEYIMSNEFYKREYPGLDIDIEYKMGILVKELNKYYRDIFNSTFIMNEKNIDIKSESDFSDYLSKHFSKQYPDYPIVLNDQLNMFKISSVQFNAFAKVLDDVVSNNEILTELYDGSSPADLIYKSIIENTKLIGRNRKVLNKIRNSLKKQLKSFPTGRVMDLVKILSRKPYGVRPYISILLTFELIKEEWNDMLLFIGETYIPSIKISDLLDYLLNRPDDLRYSFSIFDNENREYLEELERIFVSNNELVKNKSLSVRVCSNMHEWYIGLPTVTQQGVKMSFSNVAFMDIIKASRSNPTIAIERLMNEFTLVDIKFFKNNICEHFDGFLRNFEYSIEAKLGTKDLNSWAKSQDEISKKANRLVNGLVKNKNIFEIYSEDTDNLEISRWTNSSYNVLKNMIIEDYKKLQDDIEVDTVIVNGKEKFIQKVELSNKASVTYNNITNLINATSQYLTDSEVEKIILTLVDKYIS